MTSVDVNGAARNGAVSQFRSSPSQVVKSRPVGLPTTGHRRRNTVWMAGGALLMLLAAVAGLAAANGLADRQLVVVTAGPLAAGEVVEAGDLRAVPMAIDPLVQSVNPNQISELVGMMTRSEIGAGSVLHPDDLIPVDTVSTSTVIIGAPLAAGDYPRVGIKPGDQVGLIEVFATGETDETKAGATQVAEAEVAEVVPMSGDVLLISLRIESSLSVLLSQIIEESRLRLVLLEQASGESTVVPLDPAQPAEPPADETDSDTIDNVEGN